MGAYMRILKTIVIAAFTASLLISSVFAQSSGKIAGVVTDENGNPVVAANVILEGTRRGAATDLDGYFFVLNVPVGSYSVHISGLGYQALTLEETEVNGGMTTNLEIVLKSSALEMEAVTVVYKKPPIQVDQTFKLQSLKSEEMRSMPVNNVSEVLEMQAGVTRNIATSPVNSQQIFGQFATIPTDGFHFRGGREGEANYIYDGVMVRDDLWGGFEVDVFSGEGLEDISVYSGTFGPEYGEAMSGIMVFNPSNKVLDRVDWYISGSTDRVGGKTGVDGMSENTWQGEAMVAGPVPGIKNLGFSATSRYYTTDGYIYGYLYPDYVDSEGQNRQGDPEEVPMQYRDILFNTAKLNYNPTENINIGIGGFYGESQSGLYSHYFKYNPYGTPRVDLNQNLSYAKLNHALTDRTFYTVTLSHYDRMFHSGVWDNAPDYATIPQNGTGEFSTTGEDWVYFDSRYLRNGVDGKFVSQLDDRNMLTIGSSFDKAKAKMARLNPDGFIALEDYEYEPVKVSGYFSDKMEFNSIGMIVNVGLRYDYIDPARDFPNDIEDSQNGDNSAVEPSSYISPRLGLSYPISDRAAFHFGYGHYYQFPNFYKVYQGANRQATTYPAPNIQSVNGAIAVGDIKEEKTVNYEAGVQTRIGKDVTFNVTGFYRVTSNLIGTIIIEDKNGTRFPALDNINYSTVKGMEVTLKKRYSNYFSAFFNYTYSQTLVSSSLLFEQPTDVSRTFFADWDQPHVFSGSLAFAFDQDWGFTLSGGISSGFPYTFNTFAPNEERGPMLVNMDAFLYKDLTFAGFKQRVYLQVQNVLNRRNVWWVYSDSGKPGEDASPATSYDYTNNPSMWGPGRRIQLGVSLWAR